MTTTPPPSLDGAEPRRRALRLLGRFRARVFLYIAALVLTTAAFSAGIYYWRQLGFIQKDRARRAKTLLANLANQAELCAYAGDPGLCYVAAHRVFGEDDVLLVAIYDRRGREILHYSRSNLVVPPPMNELLQRSILLPDLWLTGRRQTDPSGEIYDDLYAPIVTGSRDGDETLAAGPGARPPRREAVGVARVGLSLRPAETQLDEVIRWGAYLAVLLLLLGLGAALLISRRIARPIAALTRGAEQIRDGDLAAWVAVDSDDEIGQLGSSFNEMAARLRESIAALEEQSRNLEATVERRTAEGQRAAAFSALLNAPLGRAEEGPVHETDERPGRLAPLVGPALRLLADHTGARGVALWLTREEQVEFELAIVHRLGAGVSAFAPAPPQGRLEEPCFVDGKRLQVPLRLGPEIIGCLTLLEVPTVDEVRRFVVPAAAQLAIAVSNVRAYAASAHLAGVLERRSSELKQQRDQLQEMNRLKSEFLARVSHELRTPLNAIIGYAELIGDEIYGPITPAQAEALQSVDESGRSLLDLINQILDLAKIESGKMAVHLAELDVVALIQGVLAEADALTKDRPYRVILDAPERLPLRTDGAKIKQIVSNLVTNAIKFTREGEVRVTARAEPGFGCTIEVRDTGIGIRSEDMKIIFEEFRQVDGSSTREFGGSGLGLAIAKRFAELLGGFIAVESAPGVGSTFTLHLPRDTPTAQHRRVTLPPPVPTAARREVKS